MHDQDQMVDHPGFPKWTRAVLPDFDPLVLGISAKR